MRVFFLLSLFISTAGISQEAMNAPQTGNGSYTNISKPVLDDAALHNWESISTAIPMASDDGQYFTYWVNRRNTPGRIILQSIETGWQQNLGSVRPIGFSKKSRYFIYQANDSLCFYDLKTRLIFRSIAGIRNLKLPVANKTISWLASKDNDYEWIGWQQKMNNDLFLYNLLTGQESQYHQVANYLFDQQSKVLVVQHISNKITWIDLATSQSTTAWDGGTKPQVLGAMALDAAGKQLAFVLQDTNKAQAGNSIWLYQSGMKQAEEKANNQTAGIDPGLTIANNVSFNKSGGYINIVLQRPSSPPLQRNNIKVDIWNYKDTLLQSLQLHERKTIEPSNYSATVNITNNHLVQLTHQFGDQSGFSSPGDYAIMLNNTSGDRFWLGLKDSVWVVSQKDGSRRLLTVDEDLIAHYSPNNQYLLYYDRTLHHYFSHELATGKTINLTASLPPDIMAAQTQSNYTYPFQQLGKKLIGNWTMGIAAWMEGGKIALVYDNFDIWQLDLSGRDTPINLTAGYGLKNKIRFKLALAGEPPTNLSWKEPLLLVAFNCNTKENGFFQVTPGRSNQPRQLTMAPYTYYHPSNTAYLSINNDPGMPPIRMGNNNTWIVKRQSSQEAINYYLTHDFKTFKPLTHYTPEKEYNWMQADLVTWTRPDGDVNQGLLYKPTNFDPTKKYPVIVNAYNRQSDGRYRYLEPNYTSYPICNIPYMVSRGYLVFMPDMHYMIGAHGKSGLASVESGIQALSKLAYVDTSKMALTGHSFSGQTAFYIATNSHLFKAVVAGAGWTDMISSYLQLAGSAGTAKTISYMDFLEPNFNNYTIWERPDLYQAESPVLNADKMTTPLLIFHNQADSKPFEQAVEMFVALRRLQKPAWMLQYDGAGHIVAGQQAVDFTIRITQFFDHYLKGYPAPRWMTSGIRASQKGIDDGYALDKDGKCGPNCKVCNKK